MSTALIDKHAFGKTKEGLEVSLLSLQNSSGTKAVFTDFGASLVSLECEDKNGEFGNICLGFDNIEDYERQKIFIGAVVGRFANRLAKGKIEVDGVEFQLEKNLGEHLLHGGSSSFGYQVWNVVQHEIIDGVPTLSFFHRSADGDSGFPGNVEVLATYRLYEDNRLRLTMRVSSDKKTPISLTHHAYFNLSGRAAEKDDRALEDHTFQIYSNKILTVDDDLVPNGDYRSVDNTLFDFQQPKPVNEYLFPLAPELEKSLGFDQNYCFEPWGETGEKNLLKQLKVEDKKSGRSIEISSTLPGAQFYTGNYLFDAGFTSYNAFCFEPQFYPDAPNHTNFPFTWVSPDALYEHDIEWKLSVVND